MWRRWTASSPAPGRVYAAFPTRGHPNEATTAHDLILKVLDLLGWQDWLLEQAVSRRRRSDVPDVLLFPDAAAKAAANAAVVPAQRYRHAVAILENKAWQRPLDRSGQGQAALDGVPSTQILRYLSLAEVQSERRIRWAC